MGRQEMRKKIKRSKVLKFLAGTLLFIVIIGSSMQVSFAGQDINGLLTSWFNDKRTDSIEEIDDAITIEQHKQTDRLKETLRLEIKAAEEQLQSIIDEEKSKRIIELEQYADELMEGAGISKEEIKNEKITELDGIIESAKAEMNKVSTGETVEGTEDESEE